MTDETSVIPAGWVQSRLEATVDVLDRFRVPVNADDRSTRLGQVPYYGATGQVGWIDTYLFDEELVLLGEDGAPFLDATKPKAYMIRGKTWVNNHAHVLRGKPGILNSFLMYQLNQTDFQSFVVSVHGGVCCPSAIISETAALSLFILHHQLRVMKLPEQRIHSYNLRFIRITDIE